ncbi:hypothetical protein D3C72_1726240 [compost metagenome]
MDDGDGRIMLEHLVEPRPVADVADDQRPPPDELVVTVGQVVVDHGQKARLRELEAGVGTDIAGAADHENRYIRHRWDSLLLMFHDCPFRRSALRTAV